MKKDLGSNI